MSCWIWWNCCCCCNFLKFAVFFRFRWVGSWEFEISWVLCLCVVQDWTNPWANLINGLYWINVNNVYNWHDCRRDILLRYLLLANNNLHPKTIEKDTPTGGRIESIKNQINPEAQNRSKRSITLPHIISYHRIFISISIEKKQCLVKEQKMPSRQRSVWSVDAWTSKPGKRIYKWKIRMECLIDEFDDVLWCYIIIMIERYSHCTSSNPIHPSTS